MRVSRFPKNFSGQFFLPSPDYFNIVTLNSLQFFKIVTLAAGGYRRHYLKQFSGYCIINACFIKIVQQADPLFCEQEVEFFFYPFLVHTVNIHALYFIAGR